MTRLDWAKKWIETNYNSQTSLEQNIQRGVLAWEKDFPYLASKPILMDVKRMLYRAYDSDKNYKSSGRSRNEKGLVDKHFGKSHDPTKELEQIRRTIKQRGIW